MALSERETSTALRPPLASARRRAPLRRRAQALGSAAAILVALALPHRAEAETSFERSFASVLEGETAPAEFRLGLRAPGEAWIRADDVASAAQTETAPAPRPAPKRRPFWIGAVSLATLAGSAINSFTDSPSGKFRFYNEQWLGRHTYAGGADKVSHFVSYNWTARLVGQVYYELGVPSERVPAAGSLISALAGLVTEIGDGTNKYGFSYEDLVSDFAGASTAYVTARYGLDDLLGFRTGYVPHPKVIGKPNGGTGKDYTEEIYTADIKIAGLAKRLHFRPGLARFLLFSTTYGAKGYPYAVPGARERQVGLEVGLHISEILRAAGLGDDHWWQRVLYVLLDSVRIPYTQIGVQYDLNHKAWRGPGIGDSFPGSGPKGFF